MSRGLGLEPSRKEMIWEEARELVVSDKLHLSKEDPKETADQMPKAYRSGVEIVARRHITLICSLQIGPLGSCLM